MNFPPGKLPIDVLDRLLSTHTTQQDPRVVVGARVGEDAAVIDFGDRYLIAKTDPITFATNDIGHYAIPVNANDIATMGATPRWFLATILLPEPNTDEALVETIFASLHKAAQDIGVAICGGHTEITVGLDRPIVVGQMLGEVAKENLIQSTNLQPNDCILLTKGLGIEATAIIANEKRDVLETAGILPDTITKAAQVGLHINGDVLPIAPETQQLCDLFKLDTLGVISSGALLIGVSPSDAQSVCQAILKANIPCAIIGQVKEKSFGLKITYNKTTTNLPIFDRDEIGKIFSSSS